MILCFSHRYASPKYPCICCVLDRSVWWSKLCHFVFGHHGTHCLGAQSIRCWSDLFGAHSQLLRVRGLSPRSTRGSTPAIVKRCPTPRVLAAILPTRQIVLSSFRPSQDDLALQRTSVRTSSVASDVVYFLLRERVAHLCIQNYTSTDSVWWFQVASVHCTQTTHIIILRGLRVNTSWPLLQRKDWFPAVNRRVMVIVCLWYTACLEIERLTARDCLDPVSITSEQHMWLRSLSTVNKVCICPTYLRIERHLYMAKP